MFLAQLQYANGSDVRYQIVDKRIVARDLTVADALAISALLNQQAESKTPTPSLAEQKAEQDKVNRKLDAFTAESICSPEHPCSICREGKRQQDRETAIDALASFIMEIPFRSDAAYAVGIDHSAARTGALAELRAEACRRVRAFADALSPEEKV